MPFINCRRRKPHKPHRTRSTKCNSCWRNPFCVFFMTFIALGSLRFRERTKRVVSIASQKIPSRNNNNNNNINNNNKLRLPTGRTLIQYVPVPVDSKDGEDLSSSSSSIMKYKAVTSVQGHPITVRQWARLLLASDAECLKFNQLLASVPFNAFFWETRPVRDSTSAAQQDMEFVVIDAPALYTFARNRPNEHAFAEQFATAAAAETTSTTSTTTLAGAAGAGEELSPPLPISSPPAAVVFPSLNKDAILIAPIKRMKTADAYSDLAAFCRNAPAAQTIAVWRKVVEAYLERLGGTSTGGSSSLTPAESISTTTTLDTVDTTTTITSLDALTSGANVDGDVAVDRTTPIWLSTSGTGVAWLHFRLDTRPKYYNYEPYKVEPPPLDEEPPTLTEKLSLRTRLDNVVRRNNPAKKKRHEPNL